MVKSTSGKSGARALLRDVVADARRKLDVELGRTPPPMGDELRRLMVEVARAEAMLESHQHCQSIAFGIMVNDVTGEPEPGWCPTVAVDKLPCLVEHHGNALPGGAADFPSFARPLWTRGVVGARLFDQPPMEQVATATRGVQS